MTVHDLIVPVRGVELECSGAAACTIYHHTKYRSAQ